MRRRVLVGALIGVVAGLLGVVVIVRSQSDPAPSEVVASGGIATGDAPAALDAPAPLPDLTTTTVLTTAPTTVDATAPSTVTTRHARGTSTTRAAPGPTTTTGSSSTSLPVLTGVAGRGLYTMDADGQNLRRLVPGDASLPVWSPDGSRLAVVIDGNLEVVTGDGARRRVATAVSIPRDGASWSPDGSLLAYTGGRTGSRDVIVVAADGSTAPRSIAADGDDAAVGFGPDGRLATMGSDGLFVMKADGSARRRLGQRGFNFGSLRWSPDGTHILALPDATTTRCLVDVASGQETTIGDETTLRLDSGSWAPDSHSLVLSGYDRAADHFGTFRSALDGQVTPLVRNDLEAEWVGPDRLVLTQSGDNKGTPWAIVSSRPAGADRRVLVASPDASGYRMLGEPTATSATGPIAFVAYR